MNPHNLHHDDPRLKIIEELNAPIRAFNELALNHKDRYITEITQETIVHCTRVLQVIPPHFMLALSGAGIKDRFMMVYSLFYSARNPSLDPSRNVPPAPEDEFMRINGLVLHVLCGLSEISLFNGREQITRIRQYVNPAQIKQYLESIGINLDDIQIIP